MGVNHNARNLIAVSQDHVCRLAPDPREGHQLLERPWNRPAKALDDLLRAADDAPGLRPEKAGAADQLLDLLRPGPCQSFRRRIAIKQHGGHAVYPLVGALGRKNRRDEKFEAISVSKLGLGFGIS